MDVFTGLDEEIFKSDFVLKVSRNFELIGSERIDRNVLKALEPWIDWVPPGFTPGQMRDLSCQLLPLHTIGDGNCLLHACLQSLVGKCDQQQMLRQHLAAVLTDPDTSELFKEVWLQGEKAHDASMGEAKVERQIHQLDNEWEEIVGAAVASGAYLGSFHIYILAQILKRPIIVYGDSYIRDTMGRCYAPNSLRGIFLPNQCNPQKTKKFPIAIGYTVPHAGRAGHFTSLVCVQDITKQMILVDEQGERLPVHYHNFSSNAHLSEVEWYAVCEKYLWMQTFTTSLGERFYACEVSMPQKASVGTFDSDAIRSNKKIERGPDDYYNGQPSKRPRKLEHESPVTMPKPSPLGHNTYTEMWENPRPHKPERMPTVTTPKFGARVHNMKLWEAPRRPTMFQRVYLVMGNTLSVNVSFFICFAEKMWRLLFSARSDRQCFFAWAHFSRLGAAIFVLFFLHAFCFQIVTHYQTNIVKIGMNIFYFQREEIGILFSWGALFGILVSRYFLLDAGLGFKSQPFVLLSMLVLFIHAFFGAAIGYQFALSVCKSTTSAERSCCSQICNSSHFTLTSTGAVASMLSCICFVWNNRNELSFSSITSDFRSLTGSVVKSLQTEIIASVTGSIAITMAFGLSIHLYPAILSSGPSSGSFLLCTFSCSCGTLFLVDFGTILLKTFITIPLNFETLARNTGCEGVTEQTLLLSALCLGKEYVLDRLYKKEVELNQLLRATRNTHHYQPPFTHTATWEVEVQLQNFGVELLANDFQQAKHLESFRFLWERVAQNSAVQYLNCIAALPGQSGLHTGKSIWPVCLRVCLLNVDALNLQFQVCAGRNDAIQSHNFQGSWGRNIAMYRALTGNFLLCRSNVALCGRHARLKKTWVEYLSTSIEAATKLLCSTAQDQLLYKCHNLVPVVLNSFLSCLLAIEHLHGCIIRHETQKQKKFPCPESHDICCSLQKGLSEIIKKFEGDVHNFEIPENHFGRLELLKEFECV